MDNTFKSQSVLSLCTGMRGLERGIERAIGTVRTIAYVEIEAFIIENLVQQMEQGVLDPAPVWSNLKTFPSQQFHGKVHGITGGFPCQPFSVAGKQRGTDDPRHLWPYIGGSENSIVGSIRPFWCFFENVPGHLSLGYEGVRRNLQGLGYKVKEGIFSAEEVGAPHQRKRLFILGVREDILENPECSAIWYKAREIGGRTREENVRQGDGEECSVRTRTASELGNTGLQRQEVNEIKTTGIEQSSKELADSKHNGHTPSQIGESTEARNGGCSSGENSGEQFERRGELADSSKLRIQGDGTQGEQESNPYERQGLSMCESRGNSWPARPGQEQYDWEEARTTFSKLGSHVDGDENRESIYDIVYETYTTEKRRSIEALHELWLAIESQSDEWTFGGFFSFLEEKILFSEVFRGVKITRITKLADSSKWCSVLKIQKEELRDVWFRKIIEYPSQRQECFEQLRREFADAMCILSYQITLAGRQESKTGNYNETMQYLRDNYKDAWWDVPETLSEIQKVWRPLSNKDEGRQIEAAYKSFRLELYENVFGYDFRGDLLRMAGNGVVEQTAEKAWVTLWNEIL